MKGETTGEINFWLNKSYGHKLHPFSLCALCCLVASFNLILYFQVPALHHILIKMQFFPQPLCDRGIPTHYWEVNGTVMLHCLSLVTLSARKLFHFTVFCIYHRPAKISQIHIYAHLPWDTCYLLLTFFQHLLIFSANQPYFPLSKRLSLTNHRNPLAAVHSYRSLSLLLHKKTLYPHDSSSIKISTVSSKT